jgi:hypothetical protein
MGIQYVPYKWLEVLARKAPARWGCPICRWPLPVELIRQLESCHPECRQCDPHRATGIGPQAAIREFLAGSSAA